MSQNPVFSPVMRLLALATALARGRNMHGFRCPGSYVEQLCPGGGVHLVFWKLSTAGEARAPSRQNTTTRHRPRPWQVLALVLFLVSLTTSAVPPMGAALQYQFPDRYRYIQFPDRALW